ncbi:MAG: glycosyltransferase [Candidatus Shapirobacteria bacterium]|jgi:glycosyltransferase involved in cell wall biosynthesis
MNPKVTVLMPVYNGEKYLREAVESILRQTYRDFEFLIIDDGSKDETEKILKSYGDKRIRIVQHKKNMKLVATLNEGITLAKGKYIARMDGDDISEDCRLDEQYKYLELHADVGLVGSNCKVIDADGKFVDNYYYPKNDWLIRWNMMFQSPLAHPSVMMRKAIIEKTGGYGSKTIEGREKFSGEDYDLWGKVLKISKASNIQEPLLKLRKHGKNLTIINFDGHINNTDLIEQKYIKDNVGLDLGLKLVEKLRTLKTETKDEYQLVNETIRDLERLFLEKHKLGLKERNDIRNDKAYKLLQLIINSQLGLSLKIVELIKLYATNFCFIFDTIYRFRRHL